MLIEIDNRERSLIERLNEMKVEFQVTTLDAGDIRISHNDVTIIIIERKTITDLDQSICDNRYRDQKKRLLDNYDRKCIMYIIEGAIYTQFGNISKFNVSYDRIKGAVINTLIRDDLKVMSVKDVNETAEFICDVAKRVEKNPEKYTNTDESTTPTIKNMSRHTKNSYVTKEAFVTMTLCNIPGVSNNTAFAIIKHYRTIQNLIETGNINDIAELKLSSGRRIGVKVATQVCSFIKQ